MSDHCPRAIHVYQAREKPTYIAGPYSADTEEGILCNVAIAMTVANELMRWRHVVICPHLSHYLERHTNGNFGWQWWIDYDLKLLAGAGRVVRIPGESPGASIEVDVAIGQGIRVFFWDDPEDWQELRTMYAQSDADEALAAGSGSLT